MITANLDISTIVDSINLTEELDNSTLDKIGAYVHRTYTADEHSRSEWLDRYERAQKLAAQIYTRKNHPWPGASNVKHPLMSIAAMQFHARAYPALIPSGDIVNGRIVGRDPMGLKKKRAERIGMHMSYQLLYEMKGWEEGKDKMLITLPITGCEFTKTFYNPETGQNQSNGILASNLVVHYYAKDLASASRVTEILSLSQNEVIEKQRAGIWADCDIEKIMPMPRQDNVTASKDDTQGTIKSDDDDAPYMILEQHNYLDLDGDGYKEPYIVTIEERTKKVLRIVARFEADDVQENEEGKIQKITPIEYYTKYSFIPSPDGGFYDMGFGSLLGPLNESVNTLINQLIDSGTLSIMQAGFISKGLRLRGGNLNFRPGEWKTVNAYGQDLKQSVMPLPVREPSMVLFNLLSYLVDAGEKLTSTTDMMVGENPGQNQKATTTMAVLDQGMKVFTAIYKRIRRAMGEEFIKLAKLNAIYLDEKEEFRIIEPNESELEMIEVGRDDYLDDEISVFPTADPNMANQMQRLARAQAILEMVPMGGFNEYEAKRRVLDAMEVPDIDAILPPPELQEQQPDPKMIELELKAQELQNEKIESDRRFELDRLELQHTIERDQAEAEIKSDLKDIKALETQGKIVDNAAKTSIAAKSSVKRRSKP